MRAPRVQILSISCRFWENLANSYVGAPLGSWRPLLGEILDPPLTVGHIALGIYIQKKIMPSRDVAKLHLGKVGCRNYHYEMNRNTCF